MKVSKSGYYKWKYRQENPSDKELSRQSDIELIKQKGNKIEIEEEDLGDYGYFEFKKDMIKQRFRVIVQTVSNN